MRATLATCVLATNIVAFASGAAVAHHSMAIYETFPTTIEGTVQQFKFVNPHSIILLKATEANGHSVIWFLEGDAPAMLDREGFSQNMLRPGDHIKISIHKLRSGQNGGLWGVRTILEQNGHEFVGHQCVNSPDRCNSQ